MYHINKEIVGNGESIYLKDTAKHYFKKFDILGNSIQEGTPSIEHEAPIESVGDNINLLDLASARKTGTDVGVTINKNDDGTYTINGTSTSIIANIWLLGGYTTTATLFTIPKGQYTLKDVALFSYDGTERRTISAEMGQSTTFTLNEDFNVTAVRFPQIKSATTYNDMIAYPKIEKGTKATPYSPYGQGSIEIYNCNKNLFDLKTYFENCGISRGTKTLLENGIKLDFEAGADCYTGAAVDEGILLPDVYKKTTIKVKPNTKYTLQISSAPKCFVSSLDSSYRGSSICVQIPVTYDKVIYTFTTNERTEYLHLRFGTPTTYTGTTYSFTDIQLEEGGTATEYIEHQSQTKALYTQQPFRAIGDVKDRFVKQNGVWYEEHNIKRKIFDGTESYKAELSAGLTRFNTTISDVLSISARNENCMSNYFKTSTVNEYEIIMLYETRALFYPTEDITTAEAFKTLVTEKYTNGTPLYVDYVLAEPTLIPCTPEQAEQLEYFEKEAYSYDETTNIYSTNEVSPYFEVTAYQRISEEFKTRLKEGKITRGYLKVLATDTLPEIIINENNYLKDLKIEELRYVPEEGFIGGAVAKRVTGNFNNVDNSFDIQDREIEVFLGVELEEETTEYIKYGTYIVQRPEDDQVNDNTSFEALDYMVKFNQEYKDRITYPCKLKELLNDVLDQAGVNSKVNTFANSDFIVENNQFEQGTTLRDVLKAITQVAFNWSRIDADDNLVMDFEIREETDEELGTDDYFSFKKSDDYGPVNVIVLRNSQVEGENVTIKDENLINSASGYNELKITATSKTENGITFTVNEDGTILVNGTSTADTSFLVQKLTAYETGEYILSDEANGSGTTYFTRLYRGSSGYDTIAQTTAGTTKFSLNEDTEFRTYILIRPNTTLNNILFKPMICKGNEKKEFQPYIPFGEIELVIADNPFAYTELKRKQLIEAGRRLFGLRYTPMAVDMLGLMYLNAKDRISVKNLNGEKYSTYLFDHTIDYTGIVLDSMESKAKTKTETKYQYISSLAQGLSNVEIKVDKANKKIESIVQTQEDVSEKVAKTVARIEVVYALSDSSTIEPTDGWSTTAPEWTAGKYMWQKTITTYANGTTAETAATNISGAKGEAGQNGIGITQTNITYQKSTSGTTVPTGTWQTTIPEVDENGYLWTRTEFVYSDGSKKYAYNVGKKGATGIGVKSLVDQYYLSTSNTEQAGGEWTETQPEWQDKTYIWTRTKINWTDNSITYTDPVLANTLNDINSNIVVLRELSSSQIVENGKIITRIEETTKKLNNDYSTTEQVDSKINGLEDKYETLEKRFVDIEASNKEYAIKINAIDNNGVDKIKTLMGYTFNDEGLNIDRPGADTGTIVNETGIQVLDKTGAKDTPLLYAGYVKEGNSDFPDYEGQTIVATSNLIVRNFLVIGSNSRFQDYINPILGGQGTGAYDI